MRYEVCEWCNTKGNLKMLSFFADDGGSRFANICDGCVDKLGPVQEYCSWYAPKAGYICDVCGKDELASLLPAGWIEASKLKERETAKVVCSECLGVDK